MIKNLIFDMGGVLIEWQPKIFMNRLGIVDSKVQDIVLEKTVHTKHWHDYDHGDFSFSELNRRILKDTPNKYKQEVYLFTNHWLDVCKEIKGMREYLLKLKNKGYRIYLLSNAGRNQPYYFRKYNYDFFDGKVVSCYYHVMKPDIGIYQVLMKKYHLKAQECVFFDDFVGNVKGAKNANMKAFVYKNFETFKKDLRSVL